MTCFMTCSVEEENDNERKRKCSFSLNNVVNMFRQKKSCFISCSGEDENKKRSCFGAMLINLGEWFKNSREEEEEGVE